MLIAKLSSEVIPQSRGGYASFQRSYPWLIRCRPDSDPRSLTTSKDFRHLKLPKVSLLLLTCAGLDLRICFSSPVLTIAKQQMGLVRASLKPSMDAYSFPTHQFSTNLFICASKLSHHLTIHPALHEAIPTIVEACWLFFHNFIRLVVF